MELTSKAIPADSVIELKYAEPGASGQTERPDLPWSGPPEGPKRSAPTCSAPDAPTGSGWWHWIAFDIPADVTSLAEGEPLPAGAREWVNDYGYVGYGGPCPPPGPAHHYIFTVYAMGVDTLPVSDDTPSAPTRFTILANAIDQASFTGTFAVS